MQNHTHDRGAADRDFASNMARRLASWIIMCRRWLAPAARWALRFREKQTCIPRGSA